MDEDVIDDGSGFPEGSVSDWGTWARNIGQTVITGAVDTYRYRQIAAAGGLPAVSTNGRLYTEGQRTPAPSGVVAGLGVSSGMILAGAVVLGVVVLLATRK